MIEIRPEAAAVMMEHARDSYPRECCGMLVGHGDVVVKAICCDNVYAGDQGDRFEIRTDDIFRVQKDSRQEGRELIGFFHSHPDAEAYFSATDLANASPWHRHVVLSVRSGETIAAKAFRVDLDLTNSLEEQLIWPRF